MNQNMNGCGGCGNQPVLVSYPYRQSALYQCDCCNQMHQPSTAKYPAGGSMQGNAFMVVNSVPYLMDNTTTNYGMKLSVSENVYTRVSKRADPSCINLTASIDMTGDIITNAVWKSFLDQTISGSYEVLDKVLPVQHSSVIFKLYFHIEDANKGIVYENTIDSIVKDHLFHYTDINDFFITSFKNVMVTNIPQLDYNGIYSVVIDKMEAYVDIVDTLQHVVDDLNPYYVWKDNNTHIAVQHDTVSETTDDRILIAAVDINQTFAVQLNVTTRLKFCFTAYMSNTIMSFDSFDVYQALFHPTEKLIEILARDVTILTTSVSDLQARVATLESQIRTMKPRVMEYAKNTLFDKGTLVWNEVGDLYQVTASYTSTDDESITISEAFAADIEAGKLLSIRGTTDGD